MPACTPAGLSLIHISSVLFDAAHTAGGQEAVLEVREQRGEIIRLMRADLGLTQSLSNPDFTPAQRKELVEGVFADCHLALREVLAVMAEDVYKRQSHMLAPSPGA